MNDSIVRKLQFKDIDGVRNVDGLTQRRYRGKEWDTFSEEEKEKFMKSRKNEFEINCKSVFSFVAVKDGEIVGFLFAHENLPFKDGIVVRHIAVHPNFQKKGIGKKMYGALIDKAKKEGKKTISSSINPDNMPSIKLHKQVGFRVTDWKHASLEL
ncbi:MAG: N-acetyltransferase family protein [Candidatus Wukongarchaeota archaeon]|nr:GNAT family N-acetyltransferase [Candidatus Wukongarchaeota archaeon]